MITLIGTGHVFDLSKQITDIFDQKGPDILCIELDKQRYQGLMLKQTNPEKYQEASKNQPIIYKLLARFQDGMANEYGVKAGQEMITTIEYAQSHQIPLAFIDMNAQNMFSKMLKKMSISEKIKIMFSGIGGFFISKKRVEKELNNIQDNFDDYLNEIGKKFPTIKRVLIDERNSFMAQQLTSASEKYEKIIAVVGDGHIPGLIELLKNKEIPHETIRLSEIKDKKVEINDTSTASFTIEHKQF
ncbi:MAG: TraB/GumN family protein [Candidatus Thermoplasmatota archaeon]|nr:TraB/GumN family protein [Candidatus Thermoplasmatota archaeon]